MHFFHRFCGVKVSVRPRPRAARFHAEDTIVSDMALSTGHPVGWLYEPGTPSESLRVPRDLMVVQH
jgi:hypothetical protein